MNKVLVVGSINMDLVVETGHFPAPGETLLGQRFSTFAGGKGANQAVAAQQQRRERSSHEITARRIASWYSTQHV